MPALDLVECPFTEAGSRLLVQRDGHRLVISSAEYERAVEDCRLGWLLVTDQETGRPCDVVAADPVCIDLAGGVSVVFDGEQAISVGFPSGRWRLELSELALSWRLEGESEAVEDSTRRRSVDIEIAGPARLLLSTLETPSPALSHPALKATSRKRWAAWFALMPQVRADLAEMNAQAWWVLRANQIRVGHDASRLVVAPSKLGYVAAWQWDAYFIATGLRHGDTDLGWDQIAMFLDHQLPNGLIPDVISDHGVLASADDLPPADVERLRTHLGQATGHATQTATSVPVTKPPLTAWAVWNLHQVAPDASRLAYALPRIKAAQQWWSTHSDVNGDGLAEYLHPYSSGLDDSPLFDYGVPAETPDLNSYLVVQDDILADFAAILGRTREVSELRAAAQHRCDLLVARRYDSRLGRFRAFAGGKELPTFTPFHLMPLLTGRLPASIAKTLADTVTDPRRFWQPRPLPTVAFDEPTFNGDRMWRGPIWLNVNRLIVEGLRKSGHPDLARELAERTLAMVAAGGGLHEYWNPHTGHRSDGATTSFAWSAALFVDLAVMVSGSQPRPS